MMNKKTRNTIPAEHLRLYQEIGRFVVSFETLVDMTRNVIKVNYFLESQQTSVNTLFADMTARPIFEALRSLHADIKLTNSIENNLLIDSFLSKCINLCEIRNRIVHGTFYPLFHQEDSSKELVPLEDAMYTKIRNSSKGMTFHFGRLSIEKITFYADTCNNMAVIMLNLITWRNANVTTYSKMKELVKLDLIEDLNKHLQSMNGIPPIVDLNFI